MAKKLVKPNDPEVFTGISLSESERETLLDVCRNDPYRLFPISYRNGIRVLIRNYLESICEVEELPKVNIDGPYDNDEEEKLLELSLTELDLNTVSGKKMSNEISENIKEQYRLNNPYSLDN